jgi:predicted homoserine dehydrogenase-like protein
MKARIGIAGSGYIARGLVLALQGQADLGVSRVLTRTDPSRRDDFPRPELLTTSINEIIDSSDLLVECSGDVLHATAIVDAALRAGLPVVTMDAEMQVTTGSYFVDRGLITEAEGDQPGCLAALREEALQMGFRPLVYGNIKGFLKHDPAPEDMDYWAARQGISLDKCVAFTDGTKVQFEQALVANGLDATIAADGLLGLQADSVHDAKQELAKKAKDSGHALSDFVLSPASPPGVFIVAEHDERQQLYLRNFKLGDGPYYVLLKNYHLCHLEIPKSIRRVLTGGGVLLNNSPSPAIGVAAVAKRTVEKGHVFQQAIGGFDVRGIAVKTAGNPDHAPIGLLQGAVARYRIDSGRQVTLDDVDIPDSLAHAAWKAIRNSSSAAEG